MKLQVGLSYRTRSGLKVDITTETPEEMPCTMNGWMTTSVPGAPEEELFCSWTPTGGYSENGQEHMHDIVSLWDEAPVVTTVGINANEMSKSLFRMEYEGAVEMIEEQLEHLKTWGKLFFGDKPL